MDRIKMEVPFYQVPNNIYDFGLTAHELAVYGYLARLGNNGGKAFPSYETIAKKTGMSRSTAMRCVKELETRKFIVKKVRKTNKSLNQTNIYKVQHTLTEKVNGVRKTPHSISQTPNKELQEKEELKNNKSSTKGKFFFLDQSHYLFINVYGEMYAKLSGGYRHPRITLKQMETASKRIAKQADEFNLREGKFRYTIETYWHEYVASGNHDGNINAFSKVMGKVLADEKAKD